MSKDNETQDTTQTTPEDKIDEVLDSVVANTKIEAMPEASEYFDSEEEDTQEEASSQEDEGEMPAEKKNKGSKSTSRRRSAKSTKKPKKKTKADKKKQEKIIKAVSITLGSIILALVIIYFGIAYIYYGNRFLNGTVINGYDCSNTVVADSFAQIDNDVTSFNLSIKKGNETLDTLKGSDIGINTGKTLDEITKVCAEQPKYLWLKYTYTPSDAVTTDNMVQFDSDKFNDVVSKLKSMNMKPTVLSENAKIDSSGNEYKIVPAIFGDEVNKEVLKGLITTNIQSLKPEIDIVKDDCYVKPTITEESEQLINACNNANKILKSNITLKLLGNPQAVDVATLKSWITIDKNYTVAPNTAKINEYVTNLDKTYTTYGKDRQFKTTYGDTVTVKGGDYGRRMDAESLKTALTNAVKTGTNTAVAAKFTRSALGSAENDLGTTYAEIDLTNQRMWMYSKGKVVVSTDLVSGKADGEHETPQGTYKLKYKQKDATLKGANYSTPVAWWMPFNQDIGMHDATWQPTFGGERYKLHGSHGCINLPLDKAAEIFKYAVVNMPVICYYHATAPAPGSAEATTQATTAAQ